MAFATQLPYKILKTRNSAYIPDFWAKCRALYSGGPALLSDMPLLREIMPKHLREDEEVYSERLRRAFYIPYPGAIIDQLVSQLASEQLTIHPQSTTDSATDGGTAGSDDSEDTLPSFYEDLVKSCGRPGARRMSLQEFARSQVQEALISKVAWTLVDLPTAPTQGYANLAEQEAAGALNAYLCPLDPECVVDWEEQEDGELAWVLLQETICRRTGIEASRDKVTIRWRYYLPDSWAIYEFSYEKKQRPVGPLDTDMAQLVAEGMHSFGRVPVRRLCVPDGLWAMGRLEAIARAHLNQRNALSWGQLKSLFPVPVLYAAKPDPQDPLTENMSRHEQNAGQGFLRVFAQDDKMEYLSPDSSPYAVAREDLAHLRDEMYRILSSMASSVDNSGAALKRSGESKAIDTQMTSVLLGALGTYIREHIEDLLLTVSTGRKDNLRFVAKGMDSFDDQSLDQMVQTAIGLGQVSIPSKTFQRLMKFRLAKLALGGDVSEDDLTAVEKELAQAPLTEPAPKVAEPNSTDRGSAAATRG